jgi:hypothetical protein
MANDEYNRNSNATHAGRKIYGFGAEPTPLDCMVPEQKGIGRIPEREKQVTILPPLYLGDSPPLNNIFSSIYSQIKEAREDKAKRLKEMRAFLKSAVADVDARISNERARTAATAR